MNRMTRTSTLFAAALATAAFGTAAGAADAPDFKGKTITVLLGSTTGGTTDSSTRLMAAHLSKTLPGKPDIIVQNKPGAHGITAMNYFVQQVKADGLTAVAGSNSQINPLTYRVPQAKYDPARFNMVGGINIGGTVLIARSEVVARLADKKAKPLIMGSVAGLPQTGMQMTAWGNEYLGWNARWVSGYRGLPPLILALQRGEVDMTAFATTFLNPELLDKSKFTIIYQSGSSGGTIPSSLAGIKDVPLFATAMKGKIDDPVAQKAFDFWRNIASVTIWMALPPNSSDAVIRTYRAAFAKATNDPEFMKRARNFSGDVSVVTAQNLKKNVDELAEITPEGLGYMSKILVKQGLKIEAPKKKKRKKKE